MSDNVRNLLFIAIVTAASAVGLCAVLGAVQYHDEWSRRQWVKQYDKCIEATAGDRDFCTSLSVL